MNVTMDNLFRTYRIGDKSLVPMPRVGSTAIHTRMDELGIERQEHNGSIATFVRNPYDRLVSAYTGFWNHLAFEDFVAQLVAEKPQDIHLIPQHELMQAEWIGYYESFAKDWQECCGWLDIEHQPLQQINTSLRMPLEMYYSPKVRDAVADYYKRDFEIYGYAIDMETRRRDAPSR